MRSKRTAILSPEGGEFRYQLESKNRRRFRRHHNAQYPTVAKPNRFFRIDQPNFHTVRQQRFYRDDFRDFVQWHNESDFARCSPYAEWYASLTGRYPDMAAAAPNTSGTRATSEKVPNTKPTVDAGNDQTVDEGANVTLSATSEDADGNPSNTRDGDNDQLVSGAWVWQQTQGPSVALSNNGVGREVTFTAPNVAAQTVLKFQVTVKDGTQNLSPAKFRPANSESDADEVQITVNDVP